MAKKESDRYPTKEELEQEYDMPSVYMETLQKAFFYQMPDDE